MSSSIVATSDTLLSYTGTADSSTTTSSGSLPVIANAGDTLAGSITIQVGSGATQTINRSSNNTLAGLALAINNANIGVTAWVVHQ